jgi:hypothetical protein
MFPYTHFVTMWSNYLGYTSMPNREFKREHASMSAEELAVASMPVSSMESKEGDLVPQMSTLVLKRFEGEREYYLDENPGFEYDDFFGPPQRSKSNCPGQVAEGICGQSNDCTIIHNSKPAESPSTNSMKIFQVLLAVLYSLLAAYWSQVFPGKVSVTAGPRDDIFACLFAHPCCALEWSSAKVLLLSLAQLLEGS